MQDARLRAWQYTREYGVDIPEVAEWSWTDSGAGDGVSQEAVGVRGHASDDTGADNA